MEGISKAVVTDKESSAKNPHNALEAYREAERRIAKCERGGTLDLAIAGLEEIPPSIGGASPVRVNLCPQNRTHLPRDDQYPVASLAPLAGLSSLKALNCHGTQVSDLAPLAELSALEELVCSETLVHNLAPLAKLSRLEHLTFARTPVNDLAPLAQLSALEHLDCFNSQVSDLAPLAELGALQHLNCSFTGVSNLSPLEKLGALKYLSCSFTRISDLAPLAKLRALEYLSCVQTPVSDLAPLAELTALISLNCSSTKVSELAPLAKLSALRHLNCRRTYVSDLKLLTQLQSIFDVECWGCPIRHFPVLSKIPPSLKWLVADSISTIPGEALSRSLSDNCLPRLKAHLADMQRGSKMLRDVKLLVLGNGRVGKTQLVRSLFDQSLDENIESTHAILIRPFELPDTDEDPPPCVWIWDFGGQDIYHATHTLFMRSRGIYLLAWTPDQEDNEVHTVDGQSFRNHQLPYWFNQIAQFAGTDRPLMVVQTQADALKDRRPMAAAARDSIEQFSNAVTLSHSAKTKSGQQDLIQGLREMYASIEQPLVGEVRFAVIQDLQEKVANGNPRSLSIKEFEALCDAHGGVESARLFLETLHNAGVVFYREGYFGDDIILDQQWAITAIYSVLDRKSKTFAVIESMRGEFTRSLLGGLQWDEHYTQREQELFLSMMQSCGICFRRDRGVGDAEAVYVAPDMLPSAPPSALRAQGATASQTRTYDTLPAALVRSVICAIGANAGAQGFYWRTGLSVYESSRRGWATIESEALDDNSGSLTIQADGPQAGKLLEYMADKVAAEEGRLGLEPSGITGDTRQAREVSSEENAETSAVFDQPESRTNDWFFSYANADEQANTNRPVASFCQRVQDDKGVTVRRDVNELSYGDAIAPFMRELSRGSRIYIWLTENYLKSPYCMFELHGIWRRAQEEAANGDDVGRHFDDRVVVVIDGVSLRLETDIVRYRDFWQEQLDAIKSDMDTMDPVDEITVRDRNAISRFVSNTGSILRYIRGRIRHTSIDDLEP